MIATAPAFRTITELVQRGRADAPAIVLPTGPEMAAALVAIASGVTDKLQRIGLAQKLGPGS